MDEAPALADGTPAALLYSTGWTEYGACGIPETSNGEQLLPLAVSDLFKDTGHGSRIKHAGCGAEHSVLVLDSGIVKVCGNGREGQLGLQFDQISAFQELKVPVGTDWNEKVITVAAGPKTSFALTNLGNCYAWGQNKFGVLGTEDSQAAEREAYDNRPAVVDPQILRGLQDTSIIEIATMGWHVLALSRNHRVFTWGRNHKGQCGISTICPSVSSPTEVEFLPTERPCQIAAGWEHSAALVESTKSRDDKRKISLVYMWGNPDHYRLGGVDESRHHQPQENRALSVLQLRRGLEIRQIALGGSHSLVLTMLGSVLSWGRGTFGQLGNGHSWNRLAPTVLSLSGVESVSAGFRHSIARRANGEVWAWGWNQFGECGQGDRQVNLQPHLLSSIKHLKAEQVYAGARRSLIVMSSTGHGRVSSDKVRARKDLKTRADVIPFCEDTIPYIAKSAYPSRFTCKCCKMLQLCKACAHQCHANHGLVLFMRLRKKGDRCECSLTSTCACRWSSLREAFRQVKEQDGTHVSANKLVDLLERARGKPLESWEVETAYWKLGVTRAVHIPQSIAELLRAGMLDKLQIDFNRIEEFYTQQYQLQDDADRDE